MGSLLFRIPILYFGSLLVPPVRLTFFLDRRASYIFFPSFYPARSLLSVVHHHLNQLGDSFLSLFFYFVFPISARLDSSPSLFLCPLSTTSSLFLSVVAGQQPKGEKERRKIVCMEKRSFEIRPTGLDSSPATTLRTHTHTPRQAKPTSMEICAHRRNEFGKSWQPSQSTLTLIHFESFRCNTRITTAGSAFSGSRCCCCRRRRRQLALCRALLLGPSKEPKGNVQPK